MKNEHEKRIIFFNKHYSVLEFRLLDYKEKYYLGNPQNKKCRFCGRSEHDGASFRIDAHCIPESTGNHFLLSYYECDTCNHFFGDTIESDYGNYMNLFHAASNIKGKRKTPDHISTDMKSKLTRASITGDIIPILSVTNDSTNIKKINNGFLYEDVAFPHIPIAVYKCFVKMALSVMPDSELDNLRDTFKWVRDRRHENIFGYKKLICRIKAIPGYNPTVYPCYWIFKRKGPRQCSIYPLYIFNITYGNYSFAIEVPIVSETKHDIMDVPFPPIPFKTDREQQVDLSSTSKVDNLKQSIFFAASGGYTELNPNDLSNEILNKALIKH